MRSGRGAKLKGYGICLATRKEKGPRNERPKKRKRYTQKI
jgi:hypothetical protein